MAATSTIYDNAYTQGFQGNIGWLTHTIKMALMASSYTPNYSTNVHWSDISSNEISAGGGYTTGGAQLSSMSVTVTAANSWGSAWAATTPYTVGQVVIPTSPNGFLYMAVQGGTSGGSAPTFPTVIGETVTDSGVIWANMGLSITIFSSGPVSWTNSSITAYHGVIYDANSGVASTEPLINDQNFGGAETDTNATFTVTPDATYGWFYLFA